MGILLVYDVTDERSFNSKLRDDTTLPATVKADGERRHQDLVFQRRAARDGRSQQDTHREQMRLGGEASRLGGERPAVGGRAGHTLHGGLGQEQHQRGKGLLQLGGRHQEKDHRYIKDGPGNLAGGECVGAEQQHGFCNGWEMLLME